MREYEENKGWGVRRADHMSSLKITGWTFTSICVQVEVRPADLGPQWDVATKIIIIIINIITVSDLTDV